MAQHSLALATVALLALLLAASTAHAQDPLPPEMLRDSILNDMLGLELDTVAIEANHNRPADALPDVAGFGLYAARKTDVIRPNDLPTNVATGNARQVYARVAGLHVWENDGGGLQLAIAPRGLSPNRAANFNTRQNGYDIAADAMGYPESYYTPPLEAVERLELVRGAGALQYGPQFGGLLNFELHRPPANRPLAMQLRQTVGSWGFYNAFGRVAGSIAGWQYQGMGLYRRGNGWREHAGYEMGFGYLELGRQLPGGWHLGAAYTHQQYLAQQPGGLTDRQFDENARQSPRHRNWFAVGWDLLALKAQGPLGPRTDLQLQAHGLMAKRQSLGLLERVQMADNGTLPRTFIDGRFANLGLEARLKQRLTLAGAPLTLLGGLRWYQSRTTTQQGDGPPGEEADFRLADPTAQPLIDYVNPGTNLAAFAEGVWKPWPRWSVTLGFRAEGIWTGAEGAYSIVVRNLAGELVADSTVPETLSRARGFVLLGAGLAYQLVQRPTARLELYANLTQNYRPITFSDLRVINPNFRIDPELKDERGYTAELGLRGWALNNTLRLDVSAFYLAYQDRIGEVFREDEPPFFIPYRYRTNVADSRTLGLEVLADGRLVRFRKQANRPITLRGFVAGAVLRGVYVNAQEQAVDGKQVEWVPPLNVRAGLELRWGPLEAALQWSYVHRHYSDATNAEQSPDPVVGAIPSYAVGDLSLTYRWRFLTVEAHVQNLADARYFTRRAVSYPGPGILPADGRAVFLTVGLTY